MRCGMPNFWVAHGEIMFTCTVLRVLLPKLLCFNQRFNNNDERVKSCNFSQILDPRVDTWN